MITSLNPKKKLCASLLLIFTMCPFAANIFLMMPISKLSKVGCFKEGENNASSGEKRAVRTPKVYVRRIEELGLFNPHPKRSECARGTPVMFHSEHLVIESLESTVYYTRDEKEADFILVDARPTAMQYCYFNETRNHETAITRVAEYYETDIIPKLPNFLKNRHRHLFLFGSGASIKYLHKIPSLKYSIYLTVSSDSMWDRWKDYNTIIIPPFMLPPKHKAGKNASPNHVSTLSYFRGGIDEPSPNPAHAPPHCKDFPKTLWCTRFYGYYSFGIRQSLATIYNGTSALYERWNVSDIPKESLHTASFGLVVLRDGATTSLGEVKRIQSVGGQGINSLADFEDATKNCRDCSVTLQTKFPIQVASGHVSSDTSMTEVGSALTCLCLPGWYYFTPRPVEMLVKGDCVPLIVSDSLVLPFSNTIDWQQFSIRISEKTATSGSGLADHLNQLPMSQLERFRSNIPGVRSTLMWEPHGTAWNSLVNELKPYS